MRVPLSLDKTMVIHTSEPIQTLKQIEFFSVLASVSTYSEVGSRSHKTMSYLSFTA